MILAVALLKFSRIEHRTKKFKDFLGESNRLAFLDELPEEVPAHLTLDSLRHANSLIASIHGNQCVDNHYIALCLLQDKELRHL